MTWPNPNIQRTDERSAEQPNSGNLTGLTQTPNASQPSNASLFENATQQPIKPLQVMNVSSNQDNRDLRGQGYNDGCSDALHGVISSSLDKHSNTYRLGYKEGYDACSEELTK